MHLVIDEFQFPSPDYLSDREQDTFSDYIVEMML